MQPPKLKSSRSLGTPKPCYFTAATVLLLYHVPGLGRGPLGVGEELGCRKYRGLVSRCWSPLKLKSSRSLGIPIIPATVLLLYYCCIMYYMPCTRPWASAIVGGGGVGCGNKLPSGVSHGSCLGMNGAWYPGFGTPKCLYATTVLPTVLLLHYCAADADVLLLYYLDY